MKWLAFILLFAIAQAQDYQTINLKNFGHTGLNNYHSDKLVRLTDARELINFDVATGDLTKRIGYGVVSGNTDTLCDGIMSFYDIEGDGRILKATYDGDTGVIFYSNPNSFTFTSDSMINMYGYVNPTFGYDWVLFENAVFALDGKNQPVLYMKDEWGSLHIPAPGEPTVSVLNQTAGLKGTYSYRLHYIMDTGSVQYDTVYKSFPGPATPYVFPDSEAVAIHGWPVESDHGGVTNYTCIMITRTKNNTSTYYYLDTILIDNGYPPTYWDSVYIDTFSDASLGDSIFIGDNALCNCCTRSDSVLAPGQPHVELSAWGVSGTFSYKVLGDEGNDSFYMAVSFIDTNLGIISEIGPWVKRRHTSGVDDTGATYWTYNTHPFIGNNFIDGIVVWWASPTDTGAFKVFDTIWTDDDSVLTWRELGAGDWWTWKPYDDYDSTDFLGRSYGKRPLTNKIPYDYMVYGYNRLWAAGDDDYPSRLYYSGRSDTGIIGGSGLGEWDFAFDYLSLDEDDGDPIMGLCNYAKGILAFKSHSIFFVTGVDPDYDMRVEKISHDRGVVSNNAITSHHGNVYFLTPEGKVLRISDFREISRPIRNSLDTLTIPTLSLATMVEHNDELHLVLNDTLFICDLTSPEYPWRKYSYTPKYFTYYDTASNNLYAQEKQLIFTREGTDSLFRQPQEDRTLTDTYNPATNTGNDFIASYTSPPFLTGVKSKIISGRIEAETDSGDSLYIKIYSINDTLLATITLRDGEQINRDIWEFHVNTEYSEGFYVEITESGTNEATLNIKQLDLDYVEFYR